MDEVPFVPPCKRQLPKAQEDDAEKIAYYLYYVLCSNTFPMWP